MYKKYRKKPVAIEAIHPLLGSRERVKKENMRLSEYRTGTILVDICGKVFIHDGFANADPLPRRQVFCHS